VTQIDWAARWRQLVVDREAAAHRDGGSHSDPSYWDQRARTFARTTTARSEQFLEVLRPFVTARTTVIDVGAGAGRHAVPLAERAEWVTAVEPSEGMRSHIPALPNLTMIASSWEDAEVAPADIVICSHVLYGIEDVVPFVEKMERMARERVFVMLREGPVPHPAHRLRDAMTGTSLPPMPRFSDFFMVLIGMGITPDVTFISYPVVNRYADLAEAVADVRPLFGESWNEVEGPKRLRAMLVEDKNELVCDSGESKSGIAHWKPQRAKS
jgi:SAM-dependent methyltransferase